MYRKSWSRVSETHSFKVLLDIIFTLTSTALRCACFNGIGWKCFDGIRVDFLGSSNANCPEGGSLMM